MKPNFVCRYTPFSQAQSHLLTTVSQTLWYILYLCFKYNCCNVIRAGEKYHALCIIAIGNGRVHVCCIVQNFGCTRIWQIWWFTTNLPKLYSSTILIQADLLYKQLIHQYFLYQNVF